MFKSKSLIEKITSNINTFPNFPDAIIWLTRYLQENGTIADNILVTKLPLSEKLAIESQIPKYVKKEFITIAENPDIITVGNLPKQNPYNSNRSVHCKFLKSISHSNQILERYKKRISKYNVQYYDTTIYSLFHTEILNDLGIKTEWVTDYNKSNLFKALAQYPIVVNYRKPKLATSLILLKKRDDHNHIFFSDSEFEYYYSRLNKLERDRVEYSQYLTEKEFLKNWGGCYRNQICID